MNKTQIDFGNGNFYEPYLAVKEMNTQMMASMEDIFMEGVQYSNISGTTGTTGVIPDVLSRGSEVDYVAQNFTIGDFQNVTNVLDANGGPREYHGPAIINSSVRTSITCCLVNTLTVLYLMVV